MARELDSKVEIGDPLQRSYGSETLHRVRAMRLLVLLALATGIAACDIQQGPPLYNNPPPTPAAGIHGGQPHTDCPSGYTFC
jgi:hypothetical protein